LVSRRNPSPCSCAYGTNEPTIAAMPAEGGQVSSLAELVDLLAPSVLRVHVAPKGLDVPVADVVIHDGLDAWQPAAGDLVLGVAVAVDDPAVIARWRTAPAALVVKHDDAIDEAFAAAAAGRGIAVLSVPRSSSWMHLAVLLRSLVAEADGSVPRGGDATHDLFAVANLVAGWIDAPITIEDPQSRVLAFSASQEGADAARAATILGHRVPETYRREVRRLGTVKRLLTETDPIYVRTDLPNVSPRVVIALRAGGEVLGSMWAVSEEMFTGERAAAFVDAARMVSIRLLAHRLGNDVERQHQVQSMASVLAGGTAGVDAARRLNLKGRAFRVLAIGISEPGSPDHDDPLGRCWNLLSMQLSLTHPGAAVARIGDVLYAVIPTAADAADAATAARKIADAVRGGIEQPLRDTLRIGISGQCKALADLPGARAEADQVLRVLQSSDTERLTAEMADVSVQLMLLRVADVESAQPDTTYPLLDRIEAYDGKHATGYLETLRVHLSSFGDPTVASARLGIHTNTLRYRLRRLSELFNVNLADEEERLGLMLQFYLSRR
jgi:hypothetical protein